LGTILDAIAVVLSGQAGSRLARQLAMPASADALLRRAKKAPVTPLPTPKCLGVDDFALRRGRTYGTILLDLETHRPVDLLEDRSAETLISWLKQHPGVEVISRDRSTEYLRGATEGAPQAQQVLDRWHVLKNLREAVERLFTRLYASLQSLVTMPNQTPLRQKRTASERARSEGTRLRRLARYEQVRAAYQQGGSILGIARQLKMSRQTVRKFVQASRFPEWGKAARTASALDPYRPYLSERWRQGCHMTTELWQELQARGFSGSWMMVYRWVQLQEEQEAQAAIALQPAQQPGHPSPTLVAPRHLAWLLMRELEHLDEDEQQMLAVIRRDQQVNGAYVLVQQFVRMVKEHDAKALETWLVACMTSGISELVNFAQGLQKEASALHAGLTLPYSTGPVEGKITKLKYIKRSMYGRGSFGLLRQRVLKAG
jgi:transposase